MTTAENVALLPVPEPLHGPRATGWWGMVCLIATEATLFLIMLFSYFYLRWNSPRWPPQGIALPSFNVIIPATVLLLVSSAPQQWAEFGIRRGNVGRLRLGIIIAVLLAAGFMTLELYEWGHIGFRPETNVYGSLFFTITGLHLLHLTIAICMNLYLLARSAAGHFSARRYLAVENVTLYWHFVDVVWVFVFATLYISPYIR